MKFSIKLVTLLLFAAVSFTACEKDNVDEIVIVDPGYQPGEVKVNNLFNALQTDNTPGSATMNCVTLEYPFELELRSGSTISIGSKSDLEAAMDAAAADQAVDFVFPLSIVDANGDNVQVNSNQELGRDYASCIPQQGWAAAMSTNETLPACLYGGLLCFDLVYPVGLIDEAGNTYTAANEDEFIDLFATAQSGLSFLLPITLVDEEGNETSIEGIDDFFSAAGQCDAVTPVVVSDGFVFQGFACYQLAYPAEMLDGNGNLVTVNSADEYAALVLGGEALELQYPFSLIDSAGAVITVNDLQEYILALNDCGFEIIITGNDTTCGTPSHVLLFINRGGAAMGPCRFNINYPVTLVAGGATFIVNDIIEYYSVYNAYQLNEIELIFPVSVTVNSSQEVIEFADGDELCTYVDDCE